MARSLIKEEKVKVVRDGTGEFIGCVGVISEIDPPDYGVAFGKADNTIPLPSGKWGAWFTRDELRLTKEDRSPICPTPVN